MRDRRTDPENFDRVRGNRRPATAFPALLWCAALTLVATACHPPIQVEEIELPAGWSIPTKGGASAGFTIDDSRIYLNVSIDGVEGRHIATIARDGSDYQCLTCDDLASPSLNLRHPVMASDGRRFAVRSGNGVQRFSIVECTPSVLQCDTAELIPVEVPLGAVPLLRVARLYIAPGSENVVFTYVRADGVLLPVFGALVREPDRYTVTDARALAGFRPTFSGPASALELAEGNWGEAKGFTDGGASILYYTTVDSLNYDSVKLDLATGEITRLTSDPEYDEDVDVSPDGKRVATASFRNYERMSVFSLVPRRAIVDAALRGPIALLRNQAGRRFFDTWVLPVGAAALDTKIARQIKDKKEPNDLDLNSRGQGRWSHDGTEYVFFEEDAQAIGTAHLKLARFKGRRPSTPVPVVPSPEPTWAPPVSAVLAPDELTTGSLPGAVSGHADIVFDLQLAPLSGVVDIQIAYVDYSDDGCSFLNGTETATINGLNFTWTADLDVAGCHEGFLSADIAGTIFPQTTATGDAVAEYDGIRVEGLPTGPYGEAP